jgi:hypothetical protein
MSLSDIKMWVYYRFHPKHRYNIVRTGLEPDYYDKDFLMERAIIQLVIDFFEKEEPGEDERYAELKQIYHYFKKLSLDGIHASDFSKYKDYENAYNELTRNLIRAVELRELMWT